MKKPLVAFLLLIAGTALAWVFDGAAPARAGQWGGGGQAETCAAKNGDANGDGSLDLSDPLTVLGFLFLGSPRELLPLCGTSEQVLQLQADLANAQSQLAAAHTDLTNCHTDLTTCQADAAPCQTDLAQSRTDLAAARSDLTTCQAALAKSQADLAKSQTDLAKSQTDLASCQTDLGKCRTDLTKAQADLAKSQSDLAKCQGDLQKANNDAAISAAQVTQLQAQLSDCLAGKIATLPGTNQTLCYRDGGELQACSSSTCPGQDAFYASGRAGRYVDNGDGTVSDIRTGLQWQKETADVNGDGQSLLGVDFATWCSALSYCENLNFAGHTDWRLPNLLELESIVDYGTFSPAIDSAFIAFPAAYWTSTSLVSHAEHGWKVNFGLGDLFCESKGNRSYVRAVRGGH